MYKKRNRVPTNLPSFLILGDEISTLRILGFGRFYNWFIYIYTCKTRRRFTKTKHKNYVTQRK